MLFLFFRGKNSLFVALQAGMFFRVKRHLKCTLDIFRTNIVAGLAKSHGSWLCMV